MILMETLVRIAWGSLVAVHIAPAAVLFAPALTESLYNVSSVGDLGILLVHRAALFMAIVATALYAVFDPGVRRSASIVVGISVVGYLFVYARAGMPSGAMWTIAIADTIALIPLALVGFLAWRR